MKHNIKEFPSKEKPVITVGKIKHTLQQLCQKEAFTRVNTEGFPHKM